MSLEMVLLLGSPLAGGATLDFSPTLYTNEEATPTTVLAAEPPDISTPGPIAS